MHKSITLFYPNEIKNKCSIKNLNRLAKLIKYTKYDFYSVLSENESNRKELKSLTEEIKEHNVFETAKNVSSYRIGKYDNRIPCQHLSENGLNTVADLLNFDGNYYDLKGFGPVNDERIRNCLHLLMNDISNYVETTISPEVKNNYSVKAITLAANLMNFEEFDKIAQNELENIQKFENDCKRIKRRWANPLTIFSKKKKDVLSEEYISLISNYESYLDNLNDQLVVPYNKLKYYSSDEAWQKFVSSSKKFNVFLKRYGIKVLPFVEIPVYPLARKTEISNEQINYMINIFDTYNLGEEEKHNFISEVNNKFVVDDNYPNYKIPRTILDRIGINIDDFYKVIFSFKYSKNDMFKYVIQTFYESGISYKKEGNIYTSIIDTRSIEFAYIDYLRRYYGNEMNEVLLNKKYTNFPHIDKVFDWVECPGEKESRYMIEVRNHYNSWPTDANVYNEILLFHSKINTSLHLNRQKEFRFKGEGDLFRMIKERFPDALFQFRALWLDRMSLDMYIPSLNIAIEYQGEQHFRPIGSGYKAEKNCKEQIERDKKKKSLCNKNGIKLLYWNYDVEVDDDSFDEFLNENF